MIHKNSKAPKTTVTYDRNEIEKSTGNVYEAISILAKRSEQVRSDIKSELSEKLEEFTSITDNLDEIFENKEQIELSKYFEGLPKPTAIAVTEWLKDGVYFRKPDEEKNDN
jgi:prephenate dehydrogenase